MAGQPLEAMALVALGFRTISMAPASLGPVKAMIRSLDAGAARDKLQEAVNGQGGEIRRQLEEFASQNKVEI
jgi:phosphotransferase system enzyme I (PtsP)